MVLGEAEEHWPSVAVASAGDLLAAMRRGSPTSLAGSENRPLTILDEAEDSRPSGPVGALAGDLSTVMCWGLATGQANSENGPLTVLGEAEESCLVSGLGAIGATLLLILGSSVHNSAGSNLLIRGYPGCSDPSSPRCLAESGLGV
jgi:hypothetical protein